MLFKSSLFIIEHFHIVSITDTIVAILLTDIAENVVFLGKITNSHDSYFVARQPNVCESD